MMQTHDFLWRQGMQEVMLGGRFCMVAKTKHINMG